MALKSKPASLSGLTVPKGQAAPVVASMPAEPFKEKDSSDRELERKVKLTSITVKLTPERYHQLRMEAVESGRTNQDIMVSALDVLLRTPVAERYNKK
jgi:hypothetical protein